MPRSRSRVILAFRARAAPPRQRSATFASAPCSARQAWAALPETTRARFGKRLADCRTILYAGEIVECRMNLAGRLLAHAARLIGAPLPTSRDVDVPAAVSVTEDPASGGQFWTRHLRPQPRLSAGDPFAASASPARPASRNMSAAASASRSMSRWRTARSISSATIISSACGRLRLRLPRWLAPGRMRVSHIDCNHGLFAFVLRARPSLARRADPADGDVSGFGRR